jgi:amidase
MTVKRPGLAEMRSIAESLGFSLSDRDIESYLNLMGDSFAAYDRVDAAPDYLPAVKYPRTPGYRPTAEENPYNAWYVKTEIKGAPDGKLAGKRVAIKDNIAVAGVPMMNGASILEGYTPDVDATVVTRLLDAGAVIAGKSQCEYYCLSGGSHTGAQRPVCNPNKPDHSAAGSSSVSVLEVLESDESFVIQGWWPDS